jgi:hypothetical protein
LRCWPARSSRGTSIDSNYDPLDSTLGAVLTASGNKLTPTQLASTGDRQMRFKMNRV